MKVLFVSWETYPIKSATGNCIMTIISELRKNKVEVDVLNITGDFTLPEEQRCEKGTVYNVFVSQYSNIKSLLKHNLALGLKAVTERVFLLMCSRKQNVYTSAPAIKNVINRLNIIGDKYDVLIAVCSHVINGIICDEYCERHNKKYLLYQVDPISTNIAYDNNEFMKKAELSLYKDAQYVITTPIIAKEKEINEMYSVLHNKIYAVEFPNVKNLTVDEEIKNKEKIVCFYSGRFYNGVRDCKYTLEVFKNVKNIDVELVFAGDGQEEIINEYKRTHFGSRIKHLGVISLDESFQKMQSSDVLINIGNNVNNQVPSKLFDYISTGKPIVNICKSKDCPTIPYINKYRLGINIIEGEDTVENQGAIISEFIRTKYKQRMRFEEVREAFYENTSEYVSKTFLELIEKSINQ
ncbi:hypothetical protein JS518_03665 [Clostridiales bacterium FE2010]|nr:hypothetical protein JS518_03665 [Clostridiales bacterium FE2010]